MDTALFFFHHHVLLLLHGLLDSKAELGPLNTLLPLIGIIFIIAVGVVLLNQHFHKNLFQQKLAQEELKNQHQKDLLLSSILVQEEERKRIAQDIHDELGALLSISRMHLVHLENQHQDKEAAIIPSLQNIRNLTETAISSMRRISHDLMPQQLETFGLVKTLEAVAAQANNAEGMDIQVTADDEFPNLLWPVKLGLYRINMELVNNTLKHAAASEIHIQLSFADDKVHCHYTDNGKGLANNNSTDGLGHKSIEGRVHSLGGTIALGNGSNGGFEAVITIPVGNFQS